MDIEFYDNYLSILSFSDICKNQEMKDQYIRNKLTNDFVYKFISLDDSKDSNYNKIKSLENRELWVSNIKYFEDKSEFKHTYNLSKVSKMTDRSPLAIKNFIDTTEQMNDVSCFTYEMSEYMWKHYANNRKGFCL